MATHTIQRSSISSAAAELMLSAAVSKADEIGVPAVIAVVDESGQLKAFTRMDGAPLLSIQIAQDKAYTAAAFGLATHQWFDFIKEDPPLLHGITKTSRLVVFGGGYPISVDGDLVGGVGVSGGHYSDDMKIAEAALSAL